MGRIKDQLNCCLRGTRAERLIALSVIWIAFFLAYLVLYGSVGRVFGALAVVPIGLTGLLFGLYGGLATGMLFMPVTWVFRIAAGQTVAEVITMDTVVGGLALALVGGAVGGIQEARHRSKILSNQLVETQQALISLDRRFREAFDHAPIAMAIISTGGVLTQVNEAFGELLGYTVEELVGRTWISLTHPDDVDMNVRQAQEILSGAVEVQRAEKRYVHREGYTVWALMNATAVRDSEGDVSYLVGQVVDLSDRKRAEEALEDLLRSKDEFIASVSHELRTPLTVVHGLTTELRDSMASFSEEEVRDLVGLVVEQSAEVVFIVEDLLAAARSDAGTLTVQPRSLVVREEIDRVLDSLGRPFGAALKWSDDGAAAFADPTRFRQIIRNLSTNARRYGGEKVNIEIAGDSGKVQIRFIDNGDGIEIRDRQSVFDPYVSAHQANKRPGSVGLGLTVSRRLARLMGGDLSYRYEDDVSVFELTLPASEYALAETVSESVASPKI